MDQQAKLFQSSTHVVHSNQCQFACGFYSEKYRGPYLFVIIISGIISQANELNFYKAISSRRWNPMVVWLANRNYPVGVNAILNFTAAGELILQEEDGSVVWTTNTAKKSVVGMNLTDTGNLVLFDDENSVVWQSFDHPTDCLLPGQKLCEGQKLKSSVSLTNSTSHEGMYYLQVTDKGLFAYVESNPLQAYFSTFVGLSGNDTNKGRSHVRFLNGSLSFFKHSSEQRDPDDFIYIPRASSPQYIKLMPDGHLQVFEWQPDSDEWSAISNLTWSIEECGYPLVCGRNSICSTNQQCTCPRIEYFRPVNDRQPNMGCYENNLLTCNSTKDQDFITLKNVTYFTSTSDIEGVNTETCKQACLNNCSCKAAFFKYHSNASSGECFLPSEIFTMQNYDSVVGSTVGSFVLSLVVAIGFITYIAHKRKKDAEMEEECLDQVPGLPSRFSYEELKTATENFSKKLGEGGFGSVFEGSLKDE